MIPRCPICDGLVPPTKRNKGRGRPRRFCSRRCSNSRGAFLIREAERARKTGKATTCTQCGAPITSERGPKEGGTCSYPCRRRWREAQEDRDFPDRVIEAKLAAAERQLRGRYQIDPWEQRPGVALHQRFGEHEEAA